MGQKAWRSRSLKRNPAERPWDIIDEIGQSVGRIRNKKHARAGSEGYYGDAYQTALRGPARDLFSPTGQSPDEVAETLRDSGFLGRYASVDDLWDAINAAATARREAARPDAPERQAERFTAALSKGEKAKCKRLVNASTLQPGEKIKLGGEMFLVSGIDPDSNEIELLDGKKFGRQLIPDGAMLPLDCDSAAPVSAKVKASALWLPPTSKKAKKKKAEAVKRIPGDLRYLIRRRPPERKRPVNFVAVNLGAGSVRVLRVLGSSLRPVGTFTRETLHAWAEKNGVKLPTL